MADQTQNTQVPPSKYRIEEEERTDALDMIKNGQSYGVVVDYQLQNGETRPAFDDDTLFEEIGEEYITVKVPVKKYKCVKTKKTIIERHAIQTVDKFVPYSPRPVPAPVVEQKIKYHPKPPKEERIRARMEERLRIEEEGAERNRLGGGPDEDDYTAAGKEYSPVDGNEQTDYLESGEFIEVPGKTIFKKRRIYQYVPGEIEWVEKELDLVEEKKIVTLVDKPTPKDIIKWEPEIVGTREVIRHIITEREDPNNVIIDDSQTPECERIEYQDVVDVLEVGKCIEQVAEDEVVRRQVAKFSGRVIVIERVEHIPIPIQVEIQNTVQEVEFEEVLEEEMTEEELIEWYGEDLYNLRRQSPEYPQEEMAEKFIRRPVTDDRAAGMVETPVDASPVLEQEPTVAAEVPPPSSVAAPVTVAPSVHYPSAEELRRLAAEGDDADVVGVMSAQHPVITMQYAQSAGPVHYQQPQVQHQHQQMYGHYQQ